MRQVQSVTATGLLVRNPSTFEILSLADDRHRASADGRRHGVVGVLGAALLLTLLASGCTTLGPNYERPSADVESDWEAIEDPRISAQAPTDPKWWAAAFQDPLLDQLVKTALSQNLSLRSAGLRVLQAQQNLAIAVGQQYPQQQQLTGSAQENRLSNNSADSIPGQFKSFGTFSLGFNLAWEIDVWGRFRRLVESASADLDASVASYDGVMVSLIAQVAQAYLQIRTNQAQLKVSRDNVKVQEKSLEIAKARFEGGMVTQLDVEQAETLLNNTKAEMLSFEIALQQLKNSLAILLGRTPQQMSSLLAQPAAIPTVPAEIALGMPQDLIRQRPDIRVAERQLAAQSAQIGYAITDLYPHFSVGGTISLSTNDIGGKGFADLFSANSAAGSLFGAFQWNLFNYGRLKSNVRLQDALFQQLLVDYRNTVLQAQGEVENAIVAYLKSQEQLTSYRAAAAAAQRSVDLATIQYGDGLVDYTSVIQTLDSLRAQQNTLVATQGGVATNLVEVYKALGGGWEIRATANPDDLIPAPTKEQMLKRTKYWKGVLQ